VTPTSFRCACGYAKQVGDTDGGPNVSWSDTPPLDFAACRLRFPRVAMELAIIPLRSSGGESEN